MKCIFLWIKMTRYFKLVDKYHEWQYTHDDFDLQQLNDKTEKLKRKINTFDPTFPH